MTEVFAARTSLPVPAEEAFAWHERPGAFRRLTPPWENIELLTHDGGIHDGSRATLRVKLGPIHRKWVAEHRNFQPGRQFQDVQLEGPFAEWEHTHTILPQDESSCVLEDSIRYAPPLGSVGKLLAGGMIRRSLERTFAYRHRITRHDLSSHHAAKDRPPMKVLVSGSTGLVGNMLVPFLTTGGHQVVRLVRRAGATSDPHIVWNAETGEIDATQLEGIDAVVHLAGEGIASKRWSPAQKKRLRDSRVIATQGLSEAMARCANPPKAFVCASAIGYYGDRGDEVLTENSPPGEGFLPDLCREWEGACRPAWDAGIRTVNVRIGVVLDTKGGALKNMLLPFKLGAGGVVGNGRQYWSWIGLEDLVDIIHFALTRDDLAGPVNATTPKPPTNREFTKTLGRVLSRPTIFPMPAFAARLALGEMANDLLLCSARVVPERLEQAGYPFRYPELESALRHMLGK